MLAVGDHWNDLTVLGTIDRLVQGRYLQMKLVRRQRDGFLAHTFIIGNDRSTVLDPRRHGEGERPRYVRHRPRPTTTRAYATPRKPACKAELSRELGAHHYIDSAATDTGKALTDLDGAQLVVATTTSGPARSVAGHPSGTSKDSQDALRFSVLTGTRAMIETLPLEQAAEAYDRMMSGAARFRMVLTT